MDTKSKSPLCLLAGLGLTLVGGVCLAAYCGLRWNATDSVPIGLYRLTDAAHGSYISFCLTGPYGVLANDRGYRERSIACPDGFAPLVKPIVARTGDVVTVSHWGISVNGTLLKSSIAAKQDGRGRSLSAMSDGTYQVAPGTIWVISTYNPMSYDSRYFGPISLPRIISYARPAWTF
jgi:conjugative transfer signal peptidase TraF